MKFQQQNALHNTPRQSIALAKTNAVLAIFRSLITLQLKRLKIARTFYLYILVNVY